MILTLAGTWGETSASQHVPVIAADQEALLDFPAAVTFRLSAATSTPVDRAELRYRTSGDSYSTVAVVPLEPATNVDTEYTVDAQVDYIQPGVDITYSWILSDNGGPVAQTQESTVTWIDDSFDGHRLDSEDVNLFVYDGDEDFNRYMLEVAQESADRFKLAYDVADIEPMRIWVYASNSDFASTLRQNSESWIGGVSLPEAGVIAVPIESGDDYSVERVITHEVSHHVLYQSTKNPCAYPPTWFDEGLAVVGQLAGNENDLQIALGALDEGTLPTLQTLSSSFPADAVAANRGYATSHMAIEFIISQWGEPIVGDIARAFRSGVTADQALVATLGVDTMTLDSLFRDWLAHQA